VRKGLFEFDPEKDRINCQKHGLALGEFTGFDQPPIVLTDTRLDYGENRFRAFGRIDGIGYMIAYTVRGESMRLISFRRAHEKEMQRHGR
jgi:uncharacterized DUF497 family protein